jgi:hypothetical protein
MSRARVRRRLGAGIAVAAILTALALVVLRVVDRAGRARAEAAAPLSTCPSRLLADWRDGRIDGMYPIRCYRDALDSLPVDLRVYSSAPDDIAQALSRRIQSRARTLAGAAANG